MTPILPEDIDWVTETLSVDLEGLDSGDRGRPLHPFRFLGIEDLLRPPANQSARRRLIQELHDYLQWRLHNPVPPSFLGAPVETGAPAQDSEL